MSNDPNRPPTRRDAMMGLGAGLATAPLVLATTASQAQTPTQQSRAGARREGIRDPRDAYPKPPFAAQQQPWPGLAQNMNPRPDHRETSYVGLGRLAGRKALITGGDSGMGRAAAIAYAREVVDLIRQAGRKAVAIPGDLVGSNRSTFSRSRVSTGNAASQRAAAAAWAAAGDTAGSVNVRAVRVSGVRNSFSRASCSARVAALTRSSMSSREDVKLSDSESPCGTSGMETRFLQVLFSLRTAGRCGCTGDRSKGGHRAHHAALKSSTRPRWSRRASCRSRPRSPSSRQPPCHRACCPSSSPTTGRPRSP